jgi:hypothetical protein
MLTVIAKFVGKEAAKAVFKEFSGLGMDMIKELLFGEQESEVNHYLKKLDRQMQEVVQSVKGIELRQIFQDYNRADEELEYLSRLYLGQADKQPDHPDRQNTCAYILDINRGVSEQARRMIGLLLHRNLPSYKTFLQEYSDKLAEGYPDIYSYLDKMDVVINHLRINLGEAILLREKAYADIADKESVTDLALTPAEMKLVDQYYEEVVRPVKELKAMFEAHAEEKGKQSEKVHDLRLKHFTSGKYLTAYEAGDPSCEDKPLNHEKKSMFSSEDPCMPQLYLYEPARGQDEYYMDLSFEANQSRWGRVKVKVEKESQDWKIIKLKEDEEKLVHYGEDAEPIRLREGGKPVKFMFQRWVSNKVLDGARLGRVYLNDRNDGNEHMWWQPVMSRNDRGEFEPGVFLLKHMRTKFALDSDGEKVYADKRESDYNNSAMKWRLDQKNVLHGGEYLKPEENLKSPDRRYELRFMKNGNLELFDTEEKKVLWDTRTAEKGAVKCILQKNDGHLVIYDKENKSIWATNRHSNEFDDSKLVLRNEGFFEIINKHNVSIYDTKWVFTRKDVHGLRPGESLVPGDKLISENQRYVLKFPQNGNLELFDRTDKKIRWSIDLAGKGAARGIVKEYDRRFVVYDNENNELWGTSARAKKPGEVRLVLTGRGELRVNAGSTIAWQKNTDGEEVLTGN